MSGKRERQRLTFKRNAQEVAGVNDACEKRQQVT